MASEKEPSVAIAAPRRLLAVDVLRAVAALWVVFNHAKVDEGPFWDDPLRCLPYLPLQFGYLGVTLFLVISGFCIHLAVARQMGQGQEIRANWGRFWKRRFFRLYPPYVAAIVLSIGVLILVSPGWAPLRYENVSLSWDLFTHLALVHNLFKDYNGGLGNSAFWTLGLEEQLYALYFVYLVLRRRLPSGRVLFAVGCLTLCWKCVLHVYFRTTQQWYYGSPVGEPPLELGVWLQWPFSYWFSWVLGAVAAEAYSGVIRLPEWCYRYGTAAGFAIVGFMSCEYVFVGHITPRPDGRLATLTGISDWTPVLEVVSAFSEPALAVAAWVILNRWVRAERAGRFHGPLVRPLAAIGLMSYSLYLVHMPVVSLNEHLFGLESVPMPWRSLVRLGVHVPVSLLAAWLFYYLVERHFLNAGRSRVVAKTGYSTRSVAAGATAVHT